MPKMKTKKTFAKRVKVTAKGKFKKYSNYTSHFASHKEHNQKKQLHKPSLMSKSDVKRDKELLQG